MSTDPGQHPWTGSPSDNLTSLTQLTEETLLEALNHRYQDNHIYTDVGDILVAVNPFCPVPIYTKDWSQAYSRPDVNSLAPHIFKVASRAYNAMLSEKKDQVCVISGESGAGKTESAKFIMHQVMSMCSSAGLGQKLQHKITQLNPILEAFGNAQTALNDNSSRFGKYVQLVFEPNGRIVGAGLEQYLLEKSRVCVQGEKERNFHIFYYMYAGLSASNKEQLGLKEPNKHRYLKSYPNVAADCQSDTNRDLYGVIMHSMEAIGFSDEEVQAIHTILAGVILLGDIEFKGADSGDDNAEVSNHDVAETAAKILQLESSEDLCFALTKLRTETRGEVVDKCYTTTKAADVRDALAKALYARMFQWIVSRLNGYLQPYPDNEQLTMGILDIFGFENFERNSFEQFCINLANEQLQCYFNHQIFAMEKMELAKEGLDELDITFTDNKPVLDLFLAKPIGLLSLLNDQCRGLSGTEKAFIQKCKESFGKHSNYTPHRGNALVFTVKHYAGDVEYQAEGFLEKNKDSLPDSVIEAVKFSSVRLVRTLFMRRSEHTAGNQLRKSILVKSQRSVMRAMSRRRKSSAVGRKKGGGRKLLTVSAHFRQSLDSLMERLFAATPHFVRCLKPNLEKVPGKWTQEFMLRQLQYTGMLEAVRVRREGFAYRPFFCHFFNMYRSVAFHFTDQNPKGCEVACREILAKAGLTDWKMGSSRVFLRYYHQEKLQLLLRDIQEKTVLIQKVYRGHRTRRRTQELRERQKREKELVSNFLSVMNKQCNDHFPVIVTLNRADNLLSHERFSNRREEATITCVDSYAGLDAEQKNLKKAKKFGIKMMPSLKLADSVPLRTKKSVESPQASDSESESEPTSTTVQLRPKNQIPVPRSQSRPPSENRLSTGIELEGVQLQSHSNNPKQPPVPRPRSKVSPQPEDIPENRKSADLDSKLSTSPRPTPRRRSPKPLADYTHTTTEPLLFENSSSEVPHYKLPVGGMQVLPNGLSSASSSTTSLEADLVSKTRPVPRPRKSPSPSPRHIPNSRIDSRPEIRVPLLVQNSEEVSLDFFPGSSRERGGSDAGESTLDFVHNGRAQKDCTDPTELDSEDLYPGRPSMASNLANLQLLANSKNSLFEEDGDTRRYSGVSTGSDNTSMGTPEHPPQADKRKTKRFAFRKKPKGRSRLGSTSSMGGVSSVSSEGESTDFLGFYPNLDQFTAEDFVLGQPRGTFAVCRKSSSTTSEDTSPSHVLVLSLGRSVHTVPIRATSSVTGEQFHLDNGTADTFSLLKELIDFYRTHSVADGVCLLQPRLLAGVYVSSSGHKPPVTPRKRVPPVPRRRRKVPKPTVVTEVESVA